MIGEGQPLPSACQEERCRVGNHIFVNDTSSHFINKSIFCAVLDSEGSGAQSNLGAISTVVSLKIEASFLFDDMGSLVV